MALTSAAVGLLPEKHRLKLDEAIQSRVPEFPEKPWRGTLRQLMGHMAGVRSDAGDEAPSDHCEPFRASSEPTRPSTSAC